MFIVLLNDFVYKIKAQPPGKGGQNMNTQDAKVKTTERGMHDPETIPEIESGGTCFGLPDEELFHLCEEVHDLYHSLARYAQLIKSDCSRRRTIKDVLRLYCEKTNAGQSPWARCEAAWASYVEAGCAEQTVTGNCNIGNVSPEDASKSHVASYIHESGCGNLTVLKHVLDAKSNILDRHAAAARQHGGDSARDGHQGAAPLEGDASRAAGGAGADAHEERVG